MRFRRLAGFEEGKIGIAVGDELNPSDVVLLFHGMGHRADLDLVAVGRLLDDRNVLFLGGVDGISTSSCMGWPQQTSSPPPAVNTSTMLPHRGTCRPPAG